MRFVVRRRFAAALMLITVAALTLRVIYTVTATTRPETSFYDWIFYRGEARALAHGDGFVLPGMFGEARDDAPPVASHPPLLPILLAPVSWISGDGGLDDSDMALRIFNCVLGAFGVALIGLLGRELNGDRTGLVAAGIAAVYPNLWVNDGLIMPESLAVVLTVAAVLLAVRAARHTTLARAAALGVVCGLGALARGELVLLFPVLCVPALIAGSKRSARRALKPLLVALLVVVAVVGPWIAYNLSRFEKPVFISTNFDLNLLNSSCPRTFHGRFIGALWYCDVPHVREGSDESVFASSARKRALSYIRADWPQYPVVVLARVGRTWSLFHPFDSARLGVVEGRPRWVSQLGLVFYYPLLVLAVAGAGLRRRRRAVVWPLLVPPVIVTATMLVSYGSVRYRATAEPMLVVLAAVWLTARTGRARDVASAA